MPIAFSSDAPYGPLSPWAVIAAAQDRRTPGGVVLGGTEAIDYAQALAAYLSSPGDPGGPPRLVQIGSPADLVVVSRGREPVATVINGRRIH